ncbi:MAG: DUF4437 domain-containing protein [Acetobacteraceae bacterium]|nr:DUF4437 domain-containing protein [Acetobacteraceae bacterium]MSP30269.1 DUF4437 domain-containing protein [Acetobacteraceae bacterium]
MGASYPAGAQAALLYGDPSKDAPFGLRLKMLRGYVVPPHTHPIDENITVISDHQRIGMGDKLDRAKTQPLAAGSFYHCTPGMAHYAIADVKTVVQLNSRGPAGITYVNPTDDPRNKKWSSP